MNCRPFKEYENKTQMHTKLNSISPAHLQTPSKTWRLTALAAAMGALLSVAHVDANALALGRITAMSNLGEPLVASIEIPDINAEEMASLKATLASPEAFRIAGIEYNPALSNAQITLTRRENGSSQLLIRSDKIVTDPFLNLVVNANWSTGRIVRNYTLLLDPPATKQSEAAAISAPIATLPAPVPKLTPQAVAPVPVPVPAPTPSPAPVASAPVTAPPSAAPVAMPKAAVAAKPSAAAVKAPTTNSGAQVKVSNGDTAGKIAANNLPANVSLDQMLAAMLRGNPQAFTGNNVNRLKTGAILDLPTEAQAAAISANEARQSLVAQSKDFNNFRRKLAESAPALASKTSDRVASGKIEAKVDDQKAVAVTPDKLTLSKGALTAGDKSAAAAKENFEKIAKERQAKDDASRSAELAKNIKELNTLANTAPKAPAVAATVAVPVAPTVAAVVAAAPEKTVTPPAVASPVIAAPVIVAPAVAAAPAAAAVVAPAAAPATPKPPVVAKAPVGVAPVAEPSALDFLMNDPIVLPAAGGLLIALLAGGLYANNKRKKRNAAEQAEDDALLDEHFGEKSFFNETTNEPVMEKEAPAAETAKPVIEEIEEIEPVIINGANEITLPAAPVVNAHAVVDPLTEANVYLDYGRDAQAEEILKDGLKSQPENAAIYAKLLGIYAKRRDPKNFEQMALKAKLLLTENDPQWLALSKQGFELEPSNPLYSAGAPEIDPFENMSSTEFSTRTVAQLDPQSAKSPASVDLDLDFNFASSFPEPVPAKKVEPPKTPLMDFPDFSLEPAALSAAAVTATAAAAAAIATAATHPTSAPTPAPANAPKALELDLGHLSLDLNNTESKPSTTSSAAGNGPLETKLALAQEFHAIGDKTGAKMLVNEVLTLANGTLKTRAETLLAEIS